jgi:hypothetical protein
MLKMKTYKTHVDMNATITRLVLVAALIFLRHDAVADQAPGSLSALPAPPSFGAIHRAPDGSVTLLITNTPGLTLTLQTSTDLTNWTTLATPIPVVSPDTFIDTAASPEATLFYRALYLGASADRIRASDIEPDTAADTTAPIVSFTVPANAATGVATDENIAAAFSEVMDPQTITQNTFTLRQGTLKLPGQVRYDGVTATFRPADHVAPNTTYTATITTGARDLAGNALASDFVWSFTTGATRDTIRPTVSQTVPANAATGVRSLR